MEESDAAKRAELQKPESPWKKQKGRKEEQSVEGQDEGGRNANRKDGGERGEEWS